MTNKKDYAEYPRKERFARRYPQRAQWMKEELEAKRGAAKYLLDAFKNAPKNMKEFFKELEDLVMLSREKQAKKKGRSKSKGLPSIYDLEVLQEHWTPKKKSKQKIKKIIVPVSEQEKPGVIT